MKTLFTLLATATFSLGDTPQAIIVLDASGSMWGQIEGKAKIEIARDVIAELLADLPLDLELGLVAYGHRREGDCDDIELLIPPGKVDRAKFQDTVNNIVPKGKTPLTASVEFAARALNFAEEKSSVILVTDGLENCDRDPCATAKMLEEQGIDFTAHVVAFDLTAKDALTVECLATETGGQFLPAGDAASLATAIGVAVDTIVTPEEEVEVEPILENPVTLTAPDTVAAGARFEVGFAFEGEGQGHERDFITIVPLDTEERLWDNYSYTRDGSPVEITALPDPQKAEIRYLSGQTRKTLGRRPIELTAVTATVSAATEATAASQVEITWTGPAYPGDFITIVSKDSEEKTWAKYAYVKPGESVVKVAGLPTAGPCEIRYLLGQDRTTLARADILLTEAAATLSAPESVVVGSTVPVEWTGPMTPGDFITIVTKDTPEKKWAKYAYADEKNQPAQIQAPMTPGAAEIRYIVGQGRETLARVDIELTEATVTLSAPETIVAGSDVQIEWTGPNNAGDFITVVPKDLPEKKWAKYAYTDIGSPMKVAAPLDAGEAEIRYIGGQGRDTLARIPITIEAPTIVLTAAASAEAGSKVNVEWTAPNNQGDFITIVPKSTPEKKWLKYVYANAESPAGIQAPDEAGEAEIRYIAAQDRRTLARVSITITPSSKEE
ncbi:vWA domain-containing protein [Roseibacillus persicicus]|uniref:vWA domain-containing protein n=1 Tax=Roseibacillus persicicus TaxID=454148 RepID=UPI00280D73AF|nr:VWA domain-containing protein [Roseibacillus persicicus]MDQ8190654.1 VWA domain-containing protein [Roseibacillus persicicus]